MSKIRNERIFKMGRNLLMTLMQLDIGGAETHVVELSKELANRGYNLCVASNGGEYVKELVDAGIKHFKVPLHSKKPADMIASRRMLKEIIKNEKIDIVHSHTRISSFIIGTLKKSMKFSFVTTAHWVFNTGKGLKYLTNWGEKTIAVSEDIKKYLLDNYKINEDDIFVTINGIDTKKFSPDINAEDVLSEFGFSAEDNVIVYVSRLDEDRSLVAKQLISVFAKLSDIVENLKLLVVGGGNDFENIKNMAKEVNDGLGYEAIVLTGARIDINRLISPAKLFVGVSRSALEAMAEKKPVIIAGNEGYIGLFDEEKLDVGIDTNFCCRGCEEPTKELLANDVGRFFGMWDEDIEKMSEFGRNLILNNYSVARMADDAEKAYNACGEK